MEEGESSRTGSSPGDAPIVEEGQGSGGGNTEDTFRDLPELSSSGRFPRLHQSTLLEAFASSSQLGQPDLEVDEQMDEGDHDSDEEFMAKDKQAEEEEEEMAADEVEEPAVQRHRPVKR